MVTGLRMKFVLLVLPLMVAALAAPIRADTFLDVPLVAGESTSVTYTGPDDAIFSGTFNAVGEIGGIGFTAPDFQVWAWRATGPFGSGDCDRNTLGPCSSTNTQVLGTIDDGILLLSMSISGGCSEGVTGSLPCPGFSLSPFGNFEIDVAGANPGDLFLTLTTPLPPALPLFAVGLAIFCLLGRRRKRNAASAWSGLFA
jgi:hypothetical protein